MPTIKTEKHLGPVLGAALILGATIPAAMADCSKTENGDVADKTKVVFSNESHSTPFTVRFYKHYAGTNDYGDPIETTTVAMGEKANHQFDVSNYKDGSDKVDENTVYVKITLEAGENSSIVASCEYNVKNDKSCKKARIIALLPPRGIGVEAAQTMTLSLRLRAQTARHNVQRNSTIPTASQIFGPQHSMSRNDRRKLIEDEPSLEN